MFEGRLFSSGDDGLDPYVADLEARLVLHFPEFFNGVAASRLVTRADQLTGRGLELADGFVPLAGTPLAVYFGRVVLDWPDGDFVLALPHFRRGRRTWTPSVDAGPCCRALACAGQVGPARLAGAGQDQCAAVQGGRHAHQPGDPHQ